MPGCVIFSNHVDHSSELRQWRESPTVGMRWVNEAVEERQESLRSQWHL